MALVGRAKSLLERRWAGGGGRIVFWRGLRAGAGGDGRRGEGCGIELSERDEVACEATLRVPGGVGAPPGLLCMFQPKPASEDSANTDLRISSLG